MKPLNMEVTTLFQNQYDLAAIPANLHDTAGEVYGDTLYTMYTVNNSIININIRVSIIAQNLVEHTAGNGVKGYWVGVGIDQTLINDSVTYVEWGTLNDSEQKLATLTPAEPDNVQEVDGKTYSTFYFNAANASKHDNTATILVTKGDVHYHYLLDFSMVNMKIAEPQLDSMSWDQVSVSAIKNNYLFGINLADANGNSLPEELFVHYINAAVDYVQNLLDIVITPTDFKERHDYFRNDYRNWGFIQLDHNPVRAVKRITLMYGDQHAVEIPLDWVQLDKLTGQITLFPSAGSANSLIIGQTGLLFGFQSQWDWAPRLWEVEYEAGIDEKDPSIPYDLLKETIFKRASMGILNVWGDLIIGAGIASQSVSVDGLSQSIGTTQSANNIEGMTA